MVTKRWTVLPLQGGVQRYSFSAPSFCFSATRNRRKSTTKSEKLCTSRRRFAIKNYRPCRICWFKSQSMEKRFDAFYSWFYLRKVCFWVQKHYQNAIRCVALESNHLLWAFARITLGGLKKTFWDESLGKNNDKNCATSAENKENLKTLRGNQMNLGLVEPWMRANLSTSGQNLKRYYRQWGRGIT